MLAYIKQVYLKVDRKRKTAKSVNSFIKSNIRLAAAFIIYRGRKTHTHIEQVYLVVYPKRKTAKNVKYPPPFEEVGNLSEVKFLSGC